MSLARIRRPALIVVGLLVALAATSLSQQSAAPVSGDSAIALRAPSFVLAASAQEASAVSPMGFPQDEAGISAYFKSASPVTLADVRGVYRVIEAETADYIIGSVPVADYPELFDVHVFVHREGWFVAYYLAADPVAKIADVKALTGSAIGTLLEKTLSIVSIAGGVPFSGATFYDFRYPNATHFVLVGEAWDADHSFTVELPLNYAYYERSFIRYDLGSYRNDSGGYNTYFQVDSQSLSCLGANSGLCYNYITAAQMLPDTPHTVAVDDYGVLAIVYRVP